MLECLVAAVFFEARDQPLEGQFAVAEVVMNRVASHAGLITSVMSCIKRNSFRLHMTEW